MGRRDVGIAAVTLVVVALTLLASIFIIIHGVSENERMEEYNAFSEQTCTVAHVTRTVTRCVNDTDWMGRVDVYVRPIAAPAEIDPIQAQHRYPTVRNHTFVSECTPLAGDAVRWGTRKEGLYPTRRLMACYANKHYRIIFLERDDKSFDGWHLEAGVVYLVLVLIVCGGLNYWHYRSTHQRPAVRPERVQSPHSTRNTTVFWGAPLAPVPPPYQSPVE